MLGIVTKLAPEQAKNMQKQLLEAGFLVDVTQQTIIRLLPPLTITIEEIDKFITELDGQLESVLRELEKHGV